MKFKYIAFVFLFINYQLMSQSTITVQSLDSLGYFEAIPTDPVFELLDLKGASVNQPGTISSFLGSIMTAGDKTGRLVPAYALSVAPYQIIEGSSLTLKNYVESSWTRILSNIQVSFGTAPAMDADSSIDWGVGARIVIYNAGDGRLDTDHINKLVEQAKAIFARNPIPEVGEKFDPNARKKSFDALMKEVESINTTIKKEKLSPKWNTTSFDVNIGTVYRATDSKIQNSAFTKVRLWLNGGCGGGSVQFLGQVGGLYQPGVKGIKDSMFVTAGFMFRAGGENFRIGIGSNTINFDHGTIALMGELRMSKDAWVTVAVNRQFAVGTHPVWSNSIGIKTTTGVFTF